MRGADLPRNRGVGAVGGPVEGALVLGGAGFVFPRGERVVEVADVGRVVLGHLD